MDYSATPFSFDEDARLAALADLAILDTEAEAEFDALTMVATRTFGVESAAISLIDRDRQWFKSRQNIDVCETGRDVAFCNHVVQSRQPMVVPDTHESETFRSNPLVTSDPHIRFYAGAPIFAPTGHCIGTLCLIDSEPRPDFAEDDLLLLQNFAQLAVGLIEARAKRSEAEIAAKVVAATSEAILATDRDGKIVYWNGAAERMFGYTRSQAIGEDVRIIVPARYHQKVQDWFDSIGDVAPLLQTGRFIQSAASHADGSTFPTELSLAKWGTEINGGLAAVLRDVSERKALEAERDHAKRFLDTVVSNLPSMLYVKDVETRKYLLVNKKAEALIGRSAQDMLGKSDSELFHEPGAKFEQNDRDTIVSGELSRHESTFVRDDGSCIDLRTTRILVDGPDRPNQYLLGLSEDMTDIRRSEAERKILALNDVLTGLRNRASFLAFVGRLIADSQEFAILNINIDRFKSVNDQFGYVVGDDVLRVVGKRLALFKEEGAHVARIGGDEFACVIVGDHLRGRARYLAEKAIEDITRPILLRGFSVNVGVSIGVVIYPEDGNSLEMLRQNSDVAMHRAKSENSDEPCFFDDEMDAEERDRRKLERDLRLAIEDDRIEVAFQPILHADTRKITSVEALARWTDPTLGPISPELFISIAEDAGLIDRLGQQVLRKACLAACRWPEDIRIAVNLSPRQFYSKNLVEDILEVLAETGLAHNRLHLEVTENLMISNAEEALEQLRALQDHGIQISIDDFGIGYSSLSYFQKFSFNKVKIDRSFIAELEHSRAAMAIVTAVVGLADQLSMAVVAEGVETASQRDLLHRLGCSHLQGYLISPPVDGDEISRFWENPLVAA